MMRKSIEADSDNTEEGQDADDQPHTREDCRKKGKRSDYEQEIYERGGGKQFYQILNHIFPRPPLMHYPTPDLISTH